MISQLSRFMRVAHASFAISNAAAVALVAFVAFAAPPFDHESSSVYQWSVTSAPPHWYYEWSGWGTLMKRRTAWMSGDPPKGIHALPGTIAAREMDVNPARTIKPSFTVSSKEGRAYALTVGYRSSSAGEIAFSCDGSPAVTVKLPANATRGIVQSPRPLAVPAGASVIRWALVSGAPDFQLVGLQFK